MIFPTFEIIKAKLSRRLRGRREEIRAGFALREVKGGKAREERWN